MNISKPTESEYPSFYAAYIGKVGGAGPLALLESQIAAFERAKTIADTTGDHQYADGKWTVKELLGHVADTERVFAYRLLRIARADQTPLSGFDENAWAAAAPHKARRLTDVAAELAAVRSATVALVRSLDQSALEQVGTANGKPVSARAICWMLAGHAQHHLDVLKERYDLAL